MQDAAPTAPRPTRLGWLWLAIVAIPIGSAYLRLEAQRRGYLTLEQGVVAMVLVTLALTALVAWWGVRGLRRGLRETAAANQALGERALTMAEQARELAATRDRLQESAKRIDHAERVTGRGSWEWDVTRDRAVWSPGMYALFGLDPATFANSNDNFLALVHPDDRARMGQAITDALARPGRFLQEYRLRRPDGQEIVVRGEGNVVTDDDGKARRLFGFVQDVSELRALEEQRSAAEQAVQASEARLRAVLDNATDAIVTGDGTATIVGWNRAAERIFGYTAGEAVGRAIGDLLPPDQWRDYQADIAQFMQGKPSRYVGRPREMRAVRKDGGALDIELSLAVWAGPTGPMFTGVVRDISERKQTQAIVERARERFARVFEASPVPIGLTRENGRIEDVNAAWSQATGYSRAELLDPAFSARELYEDPQERDRIIVDLRATGMVRDREVGLRRKDGTAFRALLSLEFIDLGGNTTILSLFQDITALKREQAEREARISTEAELERMRRTDRFRTEFINSTAHELATPLTPLVLGIRTLATDANLAERHRHLVESLQRSVTRLRHLVDDMVGAADLQARTLALDKRRLNLTRELRAAVAAHHPAAERAGVSLEEPDDTGVSVSADPARLQLVLGHLLGNAIKFTPAGGKVVVASRREDDVVRVVVADAGVGLTAKQMEGLWKPFAQAHDKSQRTDSGSGLGLYVSKGIVELHGGEVGCSSAGPGKGAKFWFTLPVATGHVDPLSKARAEAEGPEGPRRNLNPSVRDD